MKVRADIITAIEKELDYQDLKWGKDKPLSFPGYMLVIKKELQEAEDGWTKDPSGRDSALAEILQVAAMAVRCIQQYGITGNPIEVNSGLDDRYSPKYSK
jgi:hypothetical protein